MASVLLYTNNLPSAIEELRKLSSKINQLFTSSLFSASLPETFNLSNLNYSSTFLPEYLNEDEMLFAEAWKEFQIKTATVSKQSPSGLSWDTPGFATPAAIHPGQRYEASSRANFLTGTPTSLYMVGSISMGLILVSGRDGYRLSYDQQRKIISEVQEGLEFLATAEPNARISFHYDLRRVQVSVAPGHTSCFELSEAPWRNAALRAIGYEGSERGSASYVRSLRAQNGTDWAFVAYFAL